MTLTFSISSTPTKTVKHFKQCLETYHVYERVFYFENKIKTLCCNLYFKYS